MGTPDDAAGEDGAVAVPDVVAWRLVNERHGRRADAFSGEGARLFGGRWNSPGVRVVYLSASLSLAALETLVHADARLLTRPHVAFRVQIPDRLVLELRDEDLPRDWRARPSSPGGRAVGDAWLRSGASLALSVPSVLVPFERNYLLNPSHPEVAAARIEGPTPFGFDERLSRDDRDRAGRGPARGLGSS